jgi:hypothetical protein
LLLGRFLDGRTARWIVGRHGDIVVRFVSIRIVGRSAFHESGTGRRGGLFRLRERSDPSPDRRSTSYALILESTVATGDVTAVTRVMTARPIRERRRIHRACSHTELNTAGFDSPEASRYGLRAMRSLASRQRFAIRAASVAVAM